MARGQNDFDPNALHEHGIGEVAMQFPEDACEFLRLMPQGLASVAHIEQSRRWSGRQCRLLTVLDPQPLAQHFPQAVLTQIKADCIAVAKD